MRKLANIICALFLYIGFVLPVDPADRVHPANYYLEKIKNSVASNDHHKFIFYCKAYLKTDLNFTTNQKLFYLLANKPDFLNNALDLGLEMNETEITWLLQKTKKSEVIDIILQKHPIKSFWLAVTTNAAISDYLLQKGAQINAKESGRVPLLYIFMQAYHPKKLFKKHIWLKDYDTKKLRDHYIHLRTKGADEKAVRSYLQGMEHKFCPTNDFVPQCRKYQEMLNKFEDFEHKAQKKLHKADAKER